MKLSYQVAMPEVTPSHFLTAYHGDLREGYRLLKENGYDAAELMICHTGKETVDTIRRLGKEFGIAVSMLATGELYGRDGLALSNPDPEIRERCIKRFYEFIDIGKEFGAQVNIGRARGLYFPNVPHDETERLALESFKIISKYAEKQGVILILEPVNFLQCDFILSTADGREWVDKVGSPNFRIMLDTFHMNIEDKNIIDEIRASKGYFTYVHLSDNNRLYPGNCGLDFKAIIDAVAATGYDGYLSVEVLQQPDAATVIRESAKHILPLMSK